ncbi:MFS transporter [Sphingomonas bacterium]|uniref:MFS transporter n=1 Tax=Sphingomonas bacterium TaxID=1895847 RepID=UPI0020C742D3|nr:MFS transporter [Sphingomonas bacterium]
MVAPIERDLAIDDFHMSLLLGPAFGLFYVVVGLAAGVAVDRWPRRVITAIGVALWGAATFLTGFAGNFAMLAMGRTGVGIGESTLTPSAHALIADSFPRHRLSTAMAVFTVGAIVGGGLALLVGGAVVHALAERGAVSLPLIGAVSGWQAVFFAVGAATLLLLPLALLMREPARDRPANGAANPVRHAISFGALLRRDWRLFVLLPVGFGCTNIVAVAYVTWVPTFMMRSYGMNAAQVGLALGVQNLAAGLLGQIGGAMIVDRLYARGVKDAHPRYHIVGLLVSAPLMLLAFRAPTLTGFLIASFAFYCLTFPFVAYAAAALQLFAPDHLRGRVSSLFLALITVIGTVIGPTVVGLLTDHVFGKAGLGEALSVLTIATVPLAIAVLARVAKTMRARA